MGASHQHQAREAARPSRVAKGPVVRTTCSVWNYVLSVAAAMTVACGAGASPAFANDFSVLIDRDDAQNRWLGHMICMGRAPVFSDTDWVSPAPTSGSYIVKGHPNTYSPVPISQESIRPGMIANHFTATWDLCATKPGFFYPDSTFGGATLYTGPSPTYTPPTPYVFRGTIVSASAQGLRVRVNEVTFTPPAYPLDRGSFTPINIGPGNVVYMTLPDSVSTGEYMRQASGWVIKDHQILNPIVADGFGGKQYTWPSDLSMLREGDTGEFSLAELGVAPGEYLYGTFAVITISSDQFSPPPADCGESGLPGDLNGDGRLSLADVMALIRLLVGLPKT